jgi:hypothetical protein
MEMQPQMSKTSKLQNPDNNYNTRGDYITAFTWPTSGMINRLSNINPFAFLQSRLFRQPVAGVNRNSVAAPCGARTAKDRAARRPFAY